MARVRGDLTISQTLKVGGNILPLVSGTIDMGSTSLPFDEAHIRTVRSITASGIGRLVLGNSNSLGPSYVEVYDGGSGNPGYYIIHSEDGTPYYLTVTDGGGFYVDSGIPTGSGITTLQFGSTAVTIDGDFLYGANNISGTGNIYAGNLYGDGANITNVTASVSGSDHSTLANLDYASSGHTGFASGTHYHSGEDITSGDVGIARISTALSDYGANTISGTGNIHAGYFYGDGSNLDNVTATVSGADHSTLDNLDYASAGHTGFSQSGHNHDDSYYTETELNNGQLDNRYYTESEVNTISGVLSNEIDSDISTHASDTDAHHNESHTVASHSDTSATGAELDTLTDGSDADTLHYHDFTSLSGTRDHASLDNLDYASSGHTGFASGTHYHSGADITSGDVDIDRVSAALSDYGANTISGTGNVHAGYFYGDGSNLTNISGAGIDNIVEDTTPQLGGELDVNEKNIRLSPSPSSDQTAVGFITEMTVDVNSQGFGAPLYMAGDGNLETTNASGINTMPCIALAIETGTGTKKCLFQGFIRNDSWNWTNFSGTNGLIYIDTSVGTLTQTAPSSSGDQVQITGYATHADRMFFNPQLPMVEIS